MFIAPPRVVAAVDGGLLCSGIPAAGGEGQPTAPPSRTAALRPRTLGATTRAPATPARPRRADGHLRQLRQGDARRRLDVRRLRRARDRRRASGGAGAERRRLSRPATSRRPTTEPPAAYGAPAAPAAAKQRPVAHARSPSSSSRRWPSSPSSPCGSSSSAARRHVPVPRHLERSPHGRGRTIVRSADPGGDFKVTMTGKDAAGAEKSYTIARAPGRRRPRGHRRRLRQGERQRGAGGPGEGGRSRPSSRTSGSCSRCRTRRTSKMTVEGTSGRRLSGRLRPPAKRPSCSSRRRSSRTMAP